MTESPSRSVKSGVSGISRTSISVTLPSTHSEHVAYPAAVTQRISSDRPSGEGKGASGSGNRSDGHQNDNGTTPTQHSLTKEKLTKDQVQRLLASRIIEQAWLTYRDRQMFRLLKHAVCAAEHALSHEILRKVCPKEAEFLKDKSIQTKVRFRFGGSEFPPHILFKVYTCTNGKGVKYLSGKKMIRPASEAARDAYDQMGQRIFYDQLIQDLLQQDTHLVTDEVDVTTLKDYMQYLSILDETPAHMGGKENSWRKLTLEALPRQTIFYDVIDYLYHHRMTPRLAEELPTLVTRPFSQEMRLKHIRIIGRIRSPLVVPHPTPKSRGRPLSGGRSQQSSRRSRQACDRASRMKKMFEQEKEDVNQPHSSNLHTPHLPQAGDHTEHYGDDVEEWEVEADKLYEWTQELSLDELVATPRLATAAL